MNAKPDNSTSKYADERPQIDIESTFDADIVLRKIIEDRASILSLQGRAAANETELMKARAKQIQLNMELSQQDRDIGQLLAKAKTEIEHFNESSKKYIQGFILAFDDGDLHKLPRHPLLPSTQKLEAAVSKRKATFIEKAQVDDRVKKLELIGSQERVPKKVSQMNELAFHQAIDIAKFRFGSSCKSWLSHINKLLSDEHSVNEKANMLTEKHAKHPLTKHQKLLPGSLKRPLSPNDTAAEMGASHRTLREAKKQKSEDHPPTVATKIPYQSDLLDKEDSESAPAPDSDDVSIAEVLTQLGR
ncbi:hypothetical protein ACHAWC_007116 [Mediolabrus comicus]